MADHALLLPSFYYQNAGTAGVSAFLKAALDHARLPVRAPGAQTCRLLPSS